MAPKMLLASSAVTYLHQTFLLYFLLFKEFQGSHFAERFLDLVGVISLVEGDPVRCLVEVDPERRVVEVGLLCSQEGDFLMQSLVEVDLLRSQEGDVLAQSLGQVDLALSPLEAILVENLVEVGNQREIILIESLVAFILLYSLEQSPPVVNS